MERYFIWVLKSNQFLITFAPHFHRISKAIVKLKPEKNSGLNGIQNPWPLRYQCSALPTELSSYLGATTVTLWVCNISVEGKECKWIYERSNIWTAEKDMNLWLIIEVIHLKLKPEICILHPQRYITNSQSDQFPDGLIAQLVEHCTAIAEVTIWSHNQCL